MIWRSRCIQKQRNYEGGDNGKQQQEKGTKQPLSLVGDYSNYACSDWIDDAIINSSTVEGVGINRRVKMSWLLMTSNLLHCLFRMHFCSRNELGHVCTETIQMTTALRISVHTGCIPDTIELWLGILWWQQVEPAGHLHMIMNMKTPADRITKTPVK